MFQNIENDERIPSCKKEIKSQIRVGASYIADAIGMSNNPKQTPEDFLMDKKMKLKLYLEGKKQTTEENEHTLRGKKFESIILNHFSKETGCDILETQSYLTAAYPIGDMIVCYPDALVRLKNGELVLLEIKCPDPRNPMYKEISNNHYIQCQLEMMTFEETRKEKVNFLIYEAAFVDLEKESVVKEKSLVLKVFPDRELWKVVKSRYMKTCEFICDDSVDIKDIRVFFNDKFQLKKITEPFEW